MFIAAVIVSALLALLLLLSGIGKLRKDPMQMATQRKVGFPEDKVWMLAALEIAATFGLVAGLFWWPIGVVAATGAVLYFIGAVGAHLRVKDWNVTIPGSILLMSGAALVLRLLTIG